MAYLISANDKDEINFAPKTVVEEVLQNVRTILTTIKHQIPLDRDFGMSGDVIDMPIQQAEAVWSNEIFTQIKRYESRATIESIKFTGELDGRLTPTVEVSINET